MGILTVSCFKNKEDKKTSEDTKNDSYTSITENNTSQVNSDIFNLGKNNNQQQANNKGNIENLTPEEQQNLINNKVDPAKVSQAIKDAENGNKEAILSLAHLYYGLKDTAKAKKYLQMGVNRNYPEAIYNMAMLLKEEGNMAEANKMIAKLPKNAGNPQQIPGAEAYNRGVNYAKAGNYKDAKIQFEAAYRQGLREADIQVALLNKQTKNYDEAIKWFKLALNRGVSAANLEIGAILFDTGRQVEARSYLIKSYNSGNKALATPIAISYHKENNMSEALKWYKIAAKNGDKNAAATVERIEKGGVVEEKKNDKQTKIFLGNGNTSQSLTESTLNDVKSKSKAEEASKVEIKAEKPSTTKQQQPAQTVKSDEKSSDVNIDEIMKKKAAEYNK